MSLRISLCVLLLAGCQSESTTTTTTNETASTETTAATATTASTTPAPAAPAGRDVCAMLSADELKTAAGVVGEAKSSKSGGADVCTWMGSDGKSVIVQVYPYASSYESARSAFEGLYDTKATSLSGVGDKAFNMNGKTGPFQTATLVTQKGTTPVSVQVMGMSGNDASRTKDATAVAQVILSKL